MPDPQARPFRIPEFLAGVFYGFALIWINVYICRNFFRNLSAPMNSMHGYWAAIAERADGAWFHATWWPYWDGGIPFEFTYLPGIPFLTSVVAAVGHVPALMAFNTVAGIVYCLAPLTLFVTVWLLMRAPGYAFLAALFYSLTSVTQLLAPDAQFTWRSFWDARRLYLTAVWDDTPHLAAVAMLPLIFLFLSLSIRRRRPVYYALAALAIACATWFSAFGPVITAMVALCLLTVLHRERLGSNLALVAGIGIFAWALTAPFMSPSIIAAMQESSPHDGTGWQIGSYTALAIVILGWAILWWFLRRWTPDWRLRSFALLAYLMSAVPMTAEYLHRQFLPQPTRYKLEMEIALDACLAFALKPLIDKTPRSIRVGLLFVFLALAGEQMVGDGKFARAVLQPADLPRSIESRASLWAAQHLPEVRISMPGSIAQWSTLFTPVQQFTGGAWSMAYNLTQQHASWAVQGVSNVPDIEVRYSLAWLKAFGVGAICVAGPKSPEVWKVMLHPGKFDGILPVLWHEDDTTIFAVPRRSSSLAHVVPVGAIVSERPAGPTYIAQVERYVAALDNPALPEATFRWDGNNRSFIGVPAAAGHALSVQVSWHRGWHATVNGRNLPVLRDGLGLMWMKPECAGPCQIRMDYDGGWHLRLLRWLSFAAMAALLLVFVRAAGSAKRI
jgi:hypothetical protein